MVVPTGTASPWILMSRSWHTYTLVCPIGEVRSGADLLAEALRVEGVVRSLGPGIAAAEEAELEVGWFGYVDGEDEPTLCESGGYTEEGDEVLEAVPCAIARVVVHSWQV